MNLLKSILPVAAPALSAFAVSAAPPVEAFGRLPLMDQLELSPSGERLVSVTDVEGISLISVFDTRAGAWTPTLRGDVKETFSSRNFRVQWCRFKTERRILCGFRADYIDEWARLIITTRLVALDVNGRNSRELLLFAHPSVDIDGPVLWNNRLVGVAYQGATRDPFSRW